MDSSLGWLFGGIVESVTSQERRAAQTDVCLTFALNLSVLQTMMVFHSQQKTFYVLNVVYQHVPDGTTGSSSIKNLKGCQLFI